MNGAPLVASWSLAEVTLTAGWALITLFAAGHALLNKRDPRSAWGWIASCFLFPFAGPLAYYLLGINRIERRARRKRPPGERRGTVGAGFASDARNQDGVRLPPALGEVVRTADIVTQRPLLAGNSIAPLYNGEQAYPRMIEAIDGAQRWVALASYIFRNDASGARLLDAVTRAHQRGVAVRVLVDGFAELYSRPRPSMVLGERGVPAARFHPPRLLPPSITLNLRNHRKLLLVDGEVGFTGGMNVGDEYCVEGKPPREAVADVQFELRGPIVAQLAETFADDWRYASGERWAPPEASAAAAAGSAAAASAATAAGSAVCRTITDGPNEDLDQTVLVLLAAIAAASRSVRIVTPYFLPPRELAAALQSAALRGVEVEVILPARSDNRILDWATRNMLWQVLRRGVRVWSQPEPFCHAKLLLIDDEYAQVGSYNWDPRSLRLNFELAVEVYDCAFAQRMAAHVAAVRAQSREVRLTEILRRRLPERLRDALCWLASPYL